MKRILLLLFPGLILTLFFASQPTGPVLAKEGDELPPLCLPGVYGEIINECLVAGPSAYRTQMAQKGIVHFPVLPLQSVQPSRDLTYVNTSYGQVVSTNAPVFASLSDAQEYNPEQAIKYIDSPFSFISYTEEVVVNGSRYYMIAPGQWMTALDISRLSTVPLFQGLTFTQTPHHAFGWVLTILAGGKVETKRTPGYEINDYSGHVLKHHEIVQVYTTEKVGDDEWYMIGPDEWVHQRTVGRVIPHQTPPDGVTGSRWIEVNLFEQTLAVYDGGNLVFATLIASGIDPFWTRPGLFQIYRKLPTTPMRGSFEVDRSDAYYLEDVPWTMYFDEARALHGAYWRTQLGYPQSHGCVNLSVGDSRWLFDWAMEGDWVYVWDPSGKTPVDEDVYGAGGA